MYYDDEVSLITTNISMAAKLLQELEKTSNRYLAQEEVAGYMAHITNDEVYARWLSRDIRCIRGLAKILNEVLEGVY